MQQRTNTVNKSSYGQQRQSSPQHKASAPSTASASAEKKESKTTHYAYTLKRNEDGSLIKDDNGKAVIEFVNDVAIYLQTSDYGDTLKIVSKSGLVPKELYIRAKRAK